MLNTLLLLLLLIGYVAAHGFISEVVIDGTTYAGNIPGKYEGASPIRMISTIDPVKGATNANLNCGQDAQLAEIVAPASPGSNVTFQWTGGADGGENWPHNTGPLMTYMASCGATSCAEFNGSTAEWFKIDELGLRSNGTWYQEDIMYGDAYAITLPQNIKPGGYLIRHEIISLQLAVSMGGAEFYPSCTQVQISGSGTGTPNDTVMFPGGYSDSDPGIYVPDVYDSNLDYVFPGPSISNLASPGDGEIAAHLSGSAMLPAGTPITSGAGTASASMPAPDQSGTAPGASITAPGVLVKCKAQKPGSSVNSRSLSWRFRDHIMRRLRGWGKPSNLMPVE